MKRIMIIEDEALLREELQFLLENEGYAVVLVEHFDDILGEVLRLEPDLILLDVGLPGKDGFTVCMELRRETQVPIIFVTSRDTSMDELKGLTLGADDFITKPYNIPVLMARIKGALRRFDAGSATELMEYKGVKLDLKKGTVSYQERCCDLTQNELRILCCLMEQAGNIVARADLIEYLWDNQVFIDDNTLSVNVTRLRAKLEELGLSDYIITKRKMGYKV